MKLRLAMYLWREEEDKGVVVEGGRVKCACVYVSVCMCVCVHVCCKYTYDCSASDVGC